MSAGVKTYNFKGYLWQCPTCRAPMVSPFPKNFTLQVSHNNGVTWLTPHLPTCDAQGRER